MLLGVILALLPFAAKAQTFDALWTQFDEASQKDLPATALKVLHSIRDKAANEKADAQLLRALVTECAVAREISADSGEVVFIDFRDQSGPIHWAPGDHPGTDMTGEATGGDDYYNNSGMNAYMHFGMSMGTPFIPSPIYNTDGYPQFVRTRANDLHILVKHERRSVALCYRTLGEAVGIALITPSQEIAETCFERSETFGIGRFDRYGVELCIVIDLEFDCGIIHSLAFLINDFDEGLAYRSVVGCDVDLCEASCLRDYLFWSVIIAKSLGVHEDAS